MKQRVARVCHVCSGHRADDDRVFDRECASLAEFGYDVHLLAACDSSETARVRGVTLHGAPHFATRMARFLGSGVVARMAAELRADLYHVHEPQLLAPVIRQARGAPVIWDVHEPYLGYLSASTWLLPPLRALARFAWDKVERRSVRRCAAVVAATEWLAPRYREMHERVVVAANFPRLVWQADGDACEQRHNALVYTGNLERNRGVLQVLHAMSLLSHRGINVTLDLSGPSEPSFFQELEATVRRLALEEQVRYHGVLRHCEAIALQRKCGIGVNTSLPGAGTAFGCPVKMFEFMLARLPVVYSDLPTFQAVAGSANAGIAVDPERPERIAEAIERLVIDRQLARQLGANGRRAVQDCFNWDAESPKLADLYVDLIGAPA